MSVSPNVVILTRAELAEIKRAEFLRGVARGRFEERHDHTITEAEAIRLEAEMGF